MTCLRCPRTAIKSRGLCRVCFYTVYPKETTCGHQPHHCAKLCSPCYERRRRTLDPDRIRNSNLRHRFRLTVAEYALLAANGCNICGLAVNPSGRRLGVDHDHATGRVRGVLCHACNLAIGLLQESPERFAKALDYLQRDFALRPLADQAKLPWMRTRKQKEVGNVMV